MFTLGDDAMTRTYAQRRCTGSSVRVYTMYDNDSLLSLGFFFQPIFAVIRLLLVFLASRRKQSFFSLPLYVHRRRFIPVDGDY